MLPRQGNTLATVQGGRTAGAEGMVWAGHHTKLAPHALQRPRPAWCVPALVAAVPMPLHQALQTEQTAP